MDEQTQQYLNKIGEALITAIQVSTRTLKREIIELRQELGKDTRNIENEMNAVSAGITAEIKQVLGEEHELAKRLKKRWG